MKIKTRLQLFVVTSILFAFGIGWAGYQSSLQMARAIMTHNEAMAVVNSIFTLTQLTNDYLSNPSEKGLVQWHYGYEALSTPLSHLTNSNIGSQDLSIRMQNDFQTLGETYTRLVAKLQTIEAPNPPGDASSLSRNEQEAYQLATALETILADAIQYHETSQSSIRLEVR